MTAPTNPITLLHITDTHIMATAEDTLLGVKTAYYFEKVLEHAFNSERKFDLCLITGDLAQDPYPEAYRHMLAVLQGYNIPCICLPGNHDDFQVMQEVFSSDLVNCRKKVVLGKWQIVSLDSQIPESPDGYLSTAELSFLEKCLKENPDLFTLIAVHHNCVPCGSGWMDVMMIKNAQELLGLVKRYPNVKAIVNGHVHQAMDIQIGTVRVLSTPSTCFQFRPKTESFSLDDTSPGYRRIDLYPDGSMDTETVRIPEQLEGLQTDTQGY